MGTINRHPNRFETTAVYRHPQAKADIVLVHGLNGAPEKTWMAPNGVYWPAELLPASLKSQHANILVYGYNADVYAGFWDRHGRSPSDNFVHHHAQTLVADLTHFRKSEGTERNPLIWVVHSLGGIVAKRALLYSNDLKDPQLESLRSIYVSTYGIIFLGTPHQGAGVAGWGGIIQRMADAIVPRKIFETESVLLKSLKKDSETLQQISNHFLDIADGFKIHMAHENHKTDVKGSKVLIVGDTSASPQLPGVTYYGIEATHSGMCKFANDNAPGYRTVSTALREWVADAPTVIPHRWRAEDARRLAKADLEIAERIRLLASAPTPTTSAAPTRCKRLHTMLTDPKRRSEGTSAVLIQCLPGGGKTHLAREYVFRHERDFPAGSSGHAPSGGVEKGFEGTVRLVRRWLSARTGWLVVLDGVRFDLPGLQEYIPDARGSSLIYTSTERAVTGDPRFDNPQVMELGLLPAEKAQELLLLKLDKKRPYGVEDQAMALELVQLMGRLPVMIHVAAQHMKAAREPLVKYLKSYRSRPKAGDLEPYKAVRGELENRGDKAALNLMSLLVFFDQHLPVEMLALGISAVGKATPVKTSDSPHRKPSLINTFKVLITFALIERNEGEDVSPISSRSSRRNFDNYVGHLDLLRIHSVVQAFFIDYIHRHHEINFWLERAVGIWCRSYDEANKRIHEDTRVGLPDDYRRFLIHGQRLLQHISRFEKRYPSLAESRVQLENRLDKIQGHIDNLSHAIQANTADGSGEEHPASVFDRLSTSSQSDAPTLQSHSSQLSGLESSEDGDVGELVQSPMELLRHERLPETPYPNTTVMPTVPEITEDDDRETVVISMAGTQVHLGASEILEVVSLPPDPSDYRTETIAYDDWQEAIPHHRVIKRQETRRYHDRAGSWRDKTISDPRVGLSWETAVGAILTKRGDSRSPLGPRLTAQSEAEMVLNKIKLAAPPSREPRVRSDSQASSTRPKLLLGRNSWSLPQAQKTPDTEVAQVLPEQFSSGSGQILSSPLSWTDATIKALRKTPLGQLQPRQHRLALPTPSFSGIPTEELMPKPVVPLVVRRWDTVVVGPDGTPISSN
ncbi:hypothetical protein N0V88_005590 [Collariella sp. IMI 366227]|nr:hypothetical protein N0V88_005590 [Collariella sp. IMI 366227]